MFMLKEYNERNCRLLRPYKAIVMKTDTAGILALKM